MPREAESILILGFNGTGKTTLAKKMVTAALKRKERVLIVTPDPAEWQAIPEVHHSLHHHIATYVGARRLIYQDINTLNVVDQYYKNGLLVLDDCRSYLKANTNEIILRILIRRRQRMIDIISIAHGFTMAPPAFFTYCSRFILFRTVDSIKKREKDLINFPKMEAAQQEVNKQAETNPHFYKIIKNN